MSLSPSKRKLPHSTSPPPSYHIIKPINGGGQSAFPGRGRSLVNDDEGALWGAGRVLGSGEVVGEKKEEIGSRKRSRRGSLSDGSESDKLSLLTGSERHPPPHKKRKKIRKKKNKTPYVPKAGTTATSRRAKRKIAVAALNRRVEEESDAHLKEGGLKSVEEDEGEENDNELVVVVGEEETNREGSSETKKGKGKEREERHVRFGMNELRVYWRREAPKKVAGAFEWWIGS